SYVDHDTAFAEGLAFWTQSGVPGIQAEHWAETDEGELRRSVRISTKALFQGGLILVDMALVPWGCGVWPAVWLLGYDAPWPYAGEIDIVEGIQAMTSKHTPAGCALDQTPGLFTGTVANTNCDSTEGNSGCSIVSPSNTSFGMPFNDLGGGLFACLWDKSGIRMYNWMRADIPQDIKSEQPNTTSWETPVATWSSSTCDPYAFFHPQQIVLNVNLCGDWAGGNYGSYPYCPGTCSSYITNPHNLNNTVMLINSIKVFQMEGAPIVTEQALTANNQTGAGGYVRRLPSSGYRTSTRADMEVMLFLISALSMALGPLRTH
ncbi:concanavalin A-like lectin/glucanase domain-containing protein, partial [Kockovaella imperatae]